MKTHDGVISIKCRMCNEVQGLPITREQMREFSLPRSERRLIQEIFPNLSIGDREMLISGTCNTCWQNLYGSDEDEEE